MSKKLMKSVLAASVALIGISSGAAYAADGYGNDNGGTRTCCRHLRQKPNRLRHLLRLSNCQKSLRPRHLLRPRPQHRPRAMKN